MTTSAPSRAKATATPAPIPELLPVTSARLLSNLPMFRSPMFADVLMTCRRGRSRASVKSGLFAGRGRGHGLGMARVRQHALGNALKRCESVGGLFSFGDLLVSVAMDAMRRRHLRGLRKRSRAAVDSKGTTRGKGTAGRQIDWAWNLPLKRKSGFPLEIRAWQHDG